MQVAARNVRVVEHPELQDGMDQAWSEHAVLEQLLDMCTSFRPTKVHCVLSY